MKKRLIGIAAALWLALLFCLPVTAKTVYPEPTNQFFVNDFADVISADKEAAMQAAGEKLFDACKAQVVVVTVPDLQGRDIESYAIGLAREWGIGQKGENNGILLLLSVSERKVRIEVGTGLEGALPDSKTGRILDTYGMDSFRQNDFSTGLAAVYDSLVNEVYVEYGLEPADGYQPIEEESFSYVDALIVFFIVGFILLVLFTPLKRIFLFMPFPGPFFGGRGGRGGPGGFGGGFGGGGGFSGGGGGFSGGGSSRGF